MSLSQHTVPWLLITETDRGRNWENDSVEEKRLISRPVDAVALSQIYWLSWPTPCMLFKFQVRLVNAEYQRKKNWNLLLLCSHWFTAGDSATQSGTGSSVTEIVLPRAGPSRLPAVSDTQALLVVLVLVAFSSLVRDFGRMFAHSFPVCTFFFSSFLG